MKEYKEILKSYGAALSEGRRVAVGTVVHMEGSSYRRPGARMIVDDMGSITGAISGGCLEGDALRKALNVISNQQSRLVTYDTSDEEDASIGVQLGCEGIIHVLFEPIDHNAKVSAISLLRKAISNRRPSVLVTLFNVELKHAVQLGTVFLLEEDGTITGDIPLEGIRENILEQANETFNHKESRYFHYKKDNIEITAFVELINPVVSLVVVGAGNDAIPLVEMAEILGWQTSVVDGRSNLAKQERFVPGCQVLVSKPEAVLEKMTIDGYTAFVLMTHNYNYDKAMLQALMLKDVKYIGMLGPKKKLIKMLDDLAEKGLKPTPEERQKIYGPVGLELGSETAEEIALSIIAEIKAVFSKKNAGFLREKKDVIHSRKEMQITRIDLNP